MVRRIAFIFIAGIAVFSSSCGRKTEPLIPDSPRPGQVQGLAAAVRDNVAFLSWWVPTRNIEGKEMKQEQVRGFGVFRAEIEKGRRPRYRPVLEIDMKNPAPAEIRDGTVYWSDINLKYGRVYGYRIRAYGTAGGAGPFSEEVRVAPLLSLAPPKGVTAVAGDSYVQLSWEPVTTRTDGSKYEGFVGYNIYRGTERGRYSPSAVNKEPVRTTAYKDSPVENDVTYYYIVRSVDSPTLPWKESLDSGPAFATPKDMTPPAAPSGLTVVPGLGRIFLTWNEIPERDLAGYHVYRTQKSGRDYERLTEGPILRSTFSDETALPGVIYYYAVTAIDKAGNESPRSKEQRGFAERLR